MTGRIALDPMTSTGPICLQCQRGGSSRYTDYKMNYKDHIGPDDVNGSHVLAVLDMSVQWISKVHIRDDDCNGCHVSA